MSAILLDLGTMLGGPSPFAVLVVVFVSLLVLGVPVSYAIAVSALAGYAVLPNASPVSLVKTMAFGPQKTSLLAIPFFILAGALMGRGGIATRLIGLSRSVLGGVRGGTAQVNVLTSMFFGGISGSAVADVSSVGSVLIPAMEKEGYDKGFSTAVTVTSSTIGLIIPPSNTLVLYAAVASGIAAGARVPVGLSVKDMFFAGIVPGVLVGVALMIVCGVLSVRCGYPKGRFPGAWALAKNFTGSLWALAMVVLILGGIVLGWFTAEESAAVAVAYALFVILLVYRELSPRQIPAIIGEAVVTTGIVMFLIAASSAMRDIFVYSNLDEALGEFCLRLTQSQGLVSERVAFLLILNVALLFFGTFMDMTPGVLIFTPLFLGVAMDGFGVHPVHFGIIILINLCIGLCTPPVGNCLFVGCGISKLPLMKSVRPLLPFYAAMIAVLLVVTYWEDSVMYIPRHLDQWMGASRPVP